MSLAKRFLATLVLSFAALLLGHAEQSNKAFPTQFYGSKKNMDVVMGASKVTVCRLSPPRDDQGDLDHKKLRDFDTLKHYKAGKPIAVPDKTLVELRKVLGDPKTHDPESVKACIPIYGVRYIFTQGDYTVTVNICFLCDILVIAEVDKIVGGGSFDSASPELLRIAKSLFPKDSDLTDIE